MNDCLRVHFEFDDDGTVELFAHVRADGFAGAGSAWFNLSEVVAFAERLANAYPLSADESLELRGGYQGIGQGEGLSQEHLALRLYAIGSRGIVGARVRLATPRWQGADDRRHSVSLELRTTYESLRRFAVQLLAVARQERKDAILDATEH